MHKIFSKTFLENKHFQAKDCYTTCTNIKITKFIHSIDSHYNWFPIQNDVFGIYCLFTKTHAVYILNLNSIASFSIESHCFKCAL